MSSFWPLFKELRFYIAKKRDFVSPSATCQWKKVMEKNYQLTSRYTQRFYTENHHPTNHFTWRLLFSYLPADSRVHSPDSFLSAIVVSKTKGRAEMGNSALRLVFFVKQCHRMNCRYTIREAQQRQHFTVTLLQYKENYTFLLKCSMVPTFYLKLKS